MSSDTETPVVGEQSNLPVEKDHNRIVDALAETQDSGLRGTLTDIHPADFSDQFEELTHDEREAFIERAGDLITADVLAELEDEVVEDILPLLPASQLAEAIAELDNDDATQIIEEMEPAQRVEIMGTLDTEDREVLEASLEFDHETIGRLMQREFVASPPFWTVGNAIDHMRETGEELPDLFFNIYIVDTAFKPIGSRFRSLCGARVKLIWTISWCGL